MFSAKSLLVYCSMLVSTFANAAADESSKIIVTDDKFQPSIRYETVTQGGSLSAPQGYGGDNISWQLTGYRNRITGERAYRIDLVDTYTDLFPHKISDAFLEGGAALPTTAHVEVNSCPNGRFCRYSELVSVQLTSAQVTKAGQGNLQIELVSLNKPIIEIPSNVATSLTARMDMDGPEPSSTAPATNKKRHSRRSAPSP